MCVELLKIRISSTALWINICEHYERVLLRWKYFKDDVKETAFFWVTHEITHRREKKEKNKAFLLFILVSHPFWHLVLLSLLTPAFDYFLNCYSLTSKPDNSASGLMIASLLFLSTEQQHMTTGCVVIVQRNIDALPFYTRHLPLY